MSRVDKRIKELRNELVSCKEELDELKAGFSADEASTVLRLEGLVSGLQWALEIMEGNDDQPREGSSGVVGEGGGVVADNTGAGDT